jgi:hypothetical protein
VGITTHYVIVSAPSVLAGQPGHTYYVDTTGAYVELKFSDFAGAGIYQGQATSCAQLNNTLYLTIDDAILKGVWKWTGSGTAIFVTGSPHVSGIIGFHNRLFAYSTTVGQENRIWFTDSLILVGDGWPTINFQDIQGGDGDYITCLLPFKDKIIVFKNNSIWQLFVTADPATWLSKLFHPSLGTFNKFSAEVYKNNYYFVHNTGVYSCDGSSVTELSVTIRALFQPMRTTGYISINRSWLYLGGLVPGALNQQMLVYKLDSAFKAWSTMSTPMFTDVNNIIPSRAQGTSLVALDGSAKAYDSNQIYLGTNNGIYVLNQVAPLFATYTDTQTRPTPATYPITCQILTKQYNIGRLSRMKRNKYTYLYAQGKGAQITYSYIQDNAAIGGKLVVGSDDFIEVYRIQGAQYFRVLQLRLIESSTKPFLLTGFSFIIMLQRQASESVVGQS